MTPPHLALPDDAPPPAPPTRLRRPVWWRRIHWRLMASYVLLATFVIGTIWIFLRAVLDQAFEQDGARSLLEETHVASLLIEDAPDNDLATLDTLADRLGQRSAKHARVLSSEGLPLGDSSLSLLELSRLQPSPDDDLRTALKDGHALSIDDRDEGLITATVRVNRHTEGPLLLRFTLPRSAVSASPSAIWATMSIAALVAVIVAGILGFIASRLFSRPLIELGGVALRIAGGDFSSRVDYPVADELGLLGDSLDHLSEQLSEKLRQLTEEKRRLSTILRSMAEGVFVVNADGDVVLTNPAVRQILDLGAEPPSHLRVEDIARAPSLADAFERTQTKREPFVDEFVIQRGPQRLDVMASIAPIAEGGHLLGMVAVLNDISRVRRLERIRRDFVANVSHELRTPLTAVRGYAETLLSAGMDLPEMAEDFLATILRHSVRLSRLIDDLLALAAIEGRGLDSRLGPVDVEEVVLDVVETLQTLASEREVALGLLPIDAPLPPARAEARALRHILTNLLENALKYTLPGGRVDISFSHSTHHITIGLTDTGVGIAAEHLPRIFERFYRVDEGRSRDVGGSGLGLALVKHLANTLGASIDVDSEVGRGTTFTLQLACA